jgi:hypothetical protein
VRESSRVRELSETVRESSKVRETERESAWETRESEPEIGGTGAAVGRSERRGAGATGEKWGAMGIDYRGDRGLKGFWKPFSKTHSFGQVQSCAFCNFLKNKK